VIGAVLGALMHLLIQLPAAISLGFSWQRQFNYRDPGVRKIAKLAAPRVLELSLTQLSKSAELFLASLISTAAFTYFTFANSLQLLPLGLFGISVAKASLPTLSAQFAEKKEQQLVQTFTSLFGQMLFFLLPFSFFLAVLRIPVIRLVFGASQFDWQATVQTGYALTAFCLGLFSQGLTYLITRTFYALQDTLTPVKISILTVFINILLAAGFVLGLHLPVWSLSLAFSLSSIFQFLLLLVLLSRKLAYLKLKQLFFKFSRLFIISGLAGGLMFFLLKVMDRSVWSKQLSFLHFVGLRLPTDFVHFVLDTRYTFNLILLTLFVGSVGLGFYLLLAYLLKVEELSLLTKLLLKIKKLELIKPKAPQEKEPLTFS
jgi:putative peptidoglycan lipid II flippase